MIDWNDAILTKQSQRLCNTAEWAVLNRGRRRVQSLTLLQSMDVQGATERMSCERVQSSVATSQVMTSDPADLPPDLPLSTPNQACFANWSAKPLMSPHFVLIHPFPLLPQSQNSASVQDPYRCLNLKSHPAEVNKYALVFRWTCFLHHLLSMN